MTYRYIPLPDGEHDDERPRRVRAFIGRHKLAVVLWTLALAVLVTSGWVMLLVYGFFALLFVNYRRRKNNRKRTVVTVTVDPRHPYDS